ncbi:MAG TPA: autotransporter outer membrane beta-barrel domain-containing protein, partial [Burkholderiales bacterium]|nr:autotransporter outer membrane beta-barrel domain-containing protein [Burkholderiales bacterium]
ADVKDFRLGLAFGYARSDVDGNSAAAPQSAKVNSYQVLFYGSRSLGQDMDVNFLAGFGLHDNSTRRTINLGAGGSAQASGNFGATSANVGAGISRLYRLGSAASFTPSVRADYTWIRNNSYLESGAGALGLNVNDNDTAALVVAADGKYLREISDRARFSANLGLGFDLINDRTTITSAFAGTPTAAFSTLGMKLDPWIVRGGLGYTYRTAEGVELTGRYDLVVRSGFTNQTLSVNARWSF